MPKGTDLQIWTPRQGSVGVQRYQWFDSLYTLGGVTYPDPPLLADVNGGNGLGQIYAEINRRWQDASIYIGPKYAKIVYPTGPQLSVNKLLNDVLSNLQINLLTSEQNSIAVSPAWASRQLLRGGSDYLFELRQSLSTDGYFVFLKKSNLFATAPAASIIYQSDFSHTTVARGSSSGDTAAIYQFGSGPGQPYARNRMFVNWEIPGGTPAYNSAELYCSCAHTSSVHYPEPAILEIWLSATALPVANTDAQAAANWTTCDTTLFTNMANRIGTLSLSSADPTTNFIIPLALTSALVPAGTTCTLIYVNQAERLTAYGSTVPPDGSASRTSPSCPTKTSSDEILKLYT